MGYDHGVVICRLCQRHGKNNNFAGEGYRWELSVVAMSTLAMAAMPLYLARKRSQQHAVLAGAQRLWLKSSADPRAAGRASAARWWTI